MKRITLFCGIILASFSAQAQVHQWSRLIGGKGSEMVRSVTTDASDNIFVAGTFTDTVDFNTTPGNHVPDKHVSKGYRDVFISKYDPSGNHLWTVTFGGTEDDRINDIIMGHDAAFILVAGIYEGTADFNPSPSDQDTRSSAGATDAYLLVLNADGTFNRAFTFGGTGNDLISDIDFNRVTHEYVLAGTFEGTADLNPEVTGEDNRTSNGSEDVFLCFINGDNWTRSAGICFGGTGSDYSGGLAVDQDGFVYLCGSFSNQVNFTTSATGFTRNSAGLLDGFLVKYKSNHQPAWVETFGGQDNDLMQALAVNNNRIHVGCNFSKKVLIGSESYTSAGYYDIALMQYDTAGRFKKLVQIGGSLDDVIESIDTAGAANIVVTGAFKWHGVDFNPLGAEPFLMESTSFAGGIYLAKYDTAGLLKWAGAIDHLDINRGFDVAVNKANQTIFAGFASAVADDIYSPDILKNEVQLTMKGINDGILSVYSDPSDQAGIVNLTIPGQLGSTVIDPVNHIAVVTMPVGTNVNNLVPLIVSSLESSYTPSSGISTDFTNPVIYTITAQDRVTKNQWLVSVILEPTNVETRAKEDAVQVFPNPAIDQVTIIALCNSGKVLLYNQSGQCILTRNLSDNTRIEINVAGMTPGLYTYQIFTGNEIYLGKINVIGRP